MSKLNIFIMLCMLVIIICEVVDLNASAIIGWTAALIFYIGMQDER